jgi:hypothetical protein
MQTTLQISLKNVQKDTKAIKFEQTYFLALDLSTWSGSCSGSFNPDVTFTEVLRSLDVTALQIINY